MLINLTSQKRPNMKIQSFKDYLTASLNEKFDEFNSLDIKKLAKYIVKNDKNAQSYVVSRFAESDFVRVVKPVCRGEIILDNRELFSSIIRGQGYPVSDNPISASAFSRSKSKTIGIVYKYNGSTRGVFIPKILEAIKKLPKEEQEFLGTDIPLFQKALEIASEDNETLLIETLELKAEWINTNTVKVTNHYLEKYGYVLPNNAKDNQLVPMTDLISIQ